MATTRFTPVIHAVFNEIDQFGLLMGLPRLEGERNPEYKQRILDVMVRRAGSSYLGLIYGITRELGLQLQETLRVEAILDGDGNPLAPNPAVVFEDTKCYIYNDYLENDLLATIDRFDKDETFTLGQLKAAIDATGKYSATLLVNDDTIRSMTIFNQTSLGFVRAEDISGRGLRIRLDNTNLMPGSISVRSPNLFVRKSSYLNLGVGEYYIDEASGTLIAAQNPANGSFIRYEYKQYNKVFWSSPVILHNLQSIDFKTKMFNIEVNDNNEEFLGLPTELGADLVNELLSVFPTMWGI